MVILDKFVLSLVDSYNEGLLIVLGGSEHMLPYRRNGYVARDQSTHGSIYSLNT
jgi:hypothetical protein